MSLAAACGWTLLRALVVAVLSVPVCWRLRQALSTLGRRPRLVLWAVLLVPFFTPALLTGYAYSNFALSLVRYPLWNEVLYAALLGLRFIPVGTVLMWLAPPPPVTAEALHCARLSLPAACGLLGRFRRLAPFAAKGPLRDAFPAAAVIFLLAFQEFETASLIGAASWTVWLFDAQAGGLALGETLRRSLWPVACELVVLAVLVPLIIRTRFLMAAPHGRPARLSRGRGAFAWLFALIALTAVTGLPLVLVGGDTVEGLRIVLRNRRMFEEIAVALGFGLVAGTLAAILAGALLEAVSRRRRWAVRRLAGAGVSLLLPGLLGSLVVSLAVLWLFQRPLLRPVYDTPMPAVAALALFLLPRAVLLQLLVAAATPQQGVHVARLLSAAPHPRGRGAARELLWHLRRRGQLLAAGVLCVWGYLELLPASILAPPGMRSAIVRLYEDMHYGRNAVLSTITLLAMLAPAVVLVLAARVLRASASFAGWAGRHRPESVHST
ncbi:MAG TPA: hypothetical protein VML55_18945 [Planctomycetaceae bacterium]|nr:hypothetical protein [Planctomycetaceae bacterium]